MLQGQKRLNWSLFRRLMGGERRIGQANKGKKDQTEVMGGGGGGE